MLRVMSHPCSLRVERYLALEIARELRWNGSSRGDSHLPDAGMQIGAIKGLLALLVRLLGAPGNRDPAPNRYSALASVGAARAASSWLRRQRRMTSIGLATGQAGVPIASSSRLARPPVRLPVIRNGGAGTFDFAFIDAQEQLHAY